MGRDAGGNRNNATKHARDDLGDGDVVRGNPPRSEQAGGKRQPISVEPSVLLTWRRVRRVRDRQHPEKDVVGRERVHRLRTLHRADDNGRADTELSGHTETEVGIVVEKEKRKTLGA